ncbi:MAG: tellurium resistance protein TerC [Bacteroidetes bacterium]|nr:tellurium resistance protein TerC [Bacteroidota bacterium]
MNNLFTLHNLTDLIMLVLLQVVLGFDNLLYISLESQKAPEEKQSFVRKTGILVAIFLRILLLFALMSLIKYVKVDILKLEFEGIVEGHFNLHSLIVLGGGIFIVYTAMKEIWHMISTEGDEHKAEVSKKSTNRVLIMIILMNVVFSFDSILSAMALSKVFIVMAIAIVIGGIMMIWLADRVSAFLRKNRMYEVLGLFILLVVGIMLLTEGGELAALTIGNNQITHMNKTTFYFVIAIMVLTDIAQSRYQKKLSSGK